MNEERIQQILNVNTSKNSVNTDTLLKINLDSTQKLLPNDDINNIVDVGEIFDRERNKCSFYRIIGTLNSTVSNGLINLNNSLVNDEYTYSTFNNTIFNGDTYFDRITNNLKDIDGWFGYYNPNKTTFGLCNFIDMEPKRERFSFISDIKPYNTSVPQPISNWDLTITYPAAVDSGHTMVLNGLLICDALPATISTISMVAIGLPCKHNLSIGDTVRITGTNGYDGDHTVVRTGLDNGDLKENYFVINRPPTGAISGNSRIKRLSDGFESKYYFRIFRKIKTRNSQVIEPDDYEIYKLAFSQNIFSDFITQFTFNEDIDVSNLVDNLGRPLSELYLTIVKTSSNGLFTNVSSGIETPFISNLNTSLTNTYLTSIPVINKIHNGGSSPFPTHIPLENNVLFSSTDFYGDLVDYNQNELIETVLADVYHRFNTNNRETNPQLVTNTTINLGPRQEGYYYKSHHLIKIRNFSSYIEQGDEFTENKPSYAINMGDGRYLWRDLLPIGYNDTTNEFLDYPFTNNAHYMYGNYCFLVKRQDPFNEWGLYYAKFPADPIENKVTDRFNTNSAEDVC
jgi:hypothetical protein